MNAAATTKEAKSMAIPRSVESGTVLEMERKLKNGK